MTQTQNPSFVPPVDEHPHPQVTVRRWRTDDGRLIRADVFVGGWRTASLKTENGVARRVAREIAAL